MTRILLYTLPYCSFCRPAKRLLTNGGLAFEEIDVEFDAEKQAEMIARAGGARRVPQIFIHGRHVGSYDELDELDRTGGIASLLAQEPDQPWTLPSHDPARR
jgi:glutaredoxin 3